MKLRRGWKALLLSFAVAGTLAGSPASLPPAIILDLDGTLYDQSCGLEAILVDRIHAHCKDAYGLNKIACDELHRCFGSTIRGLMRT
eukprot:9984060-Prorocentrum_lima.AAC.1